MPSRRPPADLTGKVVVVTGGASGIGRSIALLAGRRGAHVHVCDVSLTGAVEVAAAITAAGSAATAHSLDVTEPEAVEALAARLFVDGDNVDLLFNNAGIGHAGKVVDTPLEDWRKVLDVNLMGVVHGVRAFLPHMLERKVPARIVNTASLAGLVPNPGMVPYSTSKAAVVGLSLALDTEVRHRGIRVHALCPGIIDTAIVRTSTMRGDWADRQAKAVKFYAKRGTSPDVVAADALRGASRGAVIIPSPRWQSTPAWVLERVSPSLSRKASAAAMSVLNDRAAKRSRG